MTENKETMMEEELKQEAEGQQAEENQNSEETISGDNSAEDAGETAEESADAGQSNNAEAETSESEKYLRLLAEFQNFKRRAAKEKTDIHAYANEKIMGELLPVLDNFERAFEADVETDPVAYVQGMQLIFQQMKTALEKSGLKEIGAPGEDFDPNRHNAVMMENSEEFEAGKICKVFQKGYTLNDKVVRPAMVVVAQ